MNKKHTDVHESVKLDSRERPRVSQWVRPCDTQCFPYTMHHYGVGIMASCANDQGEGTALDAKACSTPSRGVHYANSTDLQLESNMAT